LFPWIRVPLFLLGAALLVAHFGASGQRIVVIAAGIALVAILGPAAGAATASGSRARQMVWRLTPSRPAIWATVCLPSAYSLRRGRSARGKAGLASSDPAAGAGDGQALVGALDDELALKLVEGVEKVAD
jgi:hypothetical protein